MGRKERWDKYAILHKMANDPDLSAAEAARQFGLNRGTIELWCKEANISLEGHLHPRVSWILTKKRQKRLRITQELAQLNRDIKELEEQEKQDPNAAYIKPKGKKKK